MPAEHSTLDRSTSGSPGPHALGEVLPSRLSAIIRQAHRTQETQYALVEVTAPSCDPITLLHRTSVTPVVYWSGRHSDREYAGIGAKATIRLSGPGALRKAATRAEALLDRCFTVESGHESFSPRLFAGFCFEHSTPADDVWAGFDDALLLLPELTVVAGPQHMRSYLTIEVRPDSKVGALLEALDSRHSELLHVPEQGESPLPPVTFDDGNDRGAWDSAVEQVLAQMRTGNLEKVVLARRIGLSAGKPIPVWPLMRKLREAATGCFHFAFGMPGDRVFVGASPERLFHLEGRAIETDCLAGTTERGADAAEDARLADALLASPKDRLEHYYVLEDSLRRLGDLCTTMNADTKPRIVKLSTLQHLATTVRGHLKDEITAGDILQQLHPTPAVGGTPRDVALAAIRSLEPHSRGWYAGPVGWIERNRAEFAVAIRSALIAETRVHVFAGAGIVPGSVPEKEWQETRQKAEAFLKAVWR